MNNRLLSVVAFALLIAAVASFAVYRLVSARLVASAKPTTTKIVVASRNLEVGTLIKDLDVSESDWVGNRPQGAFANASEVISRGVVSPIYAGEPILETRIAAKGAGAGLAATIPKGMRAVALRVNEVVGVSGFLSPGTRVDVLIAGTPPNNRNSELGTRTKTLLQNVEVLSAGQNIQKDAEGKPVSVPVVNVLVTPEQAEILSLASNETRIQLILRNPIDTEQSKPPGTNLANLFSDTGARPAAQAKPTAPRPRPAVQPVAAKPPEKIAPPPTIVVEVIHGNQKAQVKFQEEQQNKIQSEATPK
jgi:pilus assembly protein CpaB